MDQSEGRDFTDGRSEIAHEASPGNYALKYMDGDTFNVFYVGRSNSDVRQRLHEWRNYDAFGGSRRLDNEIQPVSAAG